MIFKAEVQKLEVISMSHHMENIKAAKSNQLLHFILRTKDWSTIKYNHLTKVKYLWFLFNKRITLRAPASKTNASDIYLQNFIPLLKSNLKYTKLHSTIFQVNT